MRIALTREAGRNDTLRTWLPPDARALEVPLTTTTYFDVGDVRAALDVARTRGAFRSLVLTSERGVGFVDLALRVSMPDVEIFAVGAITATALSAHDVTVHVTGNGPAESLAAQISKDPVLLLGAKEMRGGLTDHLKSKGLQVEHVACYETVGVTLSPDDVEELRSADVALIGAPSAWTVARDFVSATTWIVVPGQSTAEAVRLDHARVIEGWGPQLSSRLAELTASPED